MDIYSERYNFKYFIMNNNLYPSHIEIKKI